jgi:mycothiol synthase
MNPTLPIQPLQIPQLDEAAWQGLIAFIQRMQAESLPDDPPNPPQEIRHSWSAIPPVLTRCAWYVPGPGGDGMVALASVDYINMEENKHIGQCNVRVLPEYRRQGLGRALIQQVAQNALAHQRRLLVFPTSDLVPSGAEFAHRMGAQEGLALQINQLKLAELEDGLLESWIQRARERAEGFELRFWEGPYPADILPPMAHIKQTMNQAPTGDLEFEDIQYTPDILRQIDQSLFGGGNQRWTFYAVEKESGSLAGYTELIWQAGKLTIAQQGDTAVSDTYRNRGLGRWLKAAMLERVRHESPDTVYVRTSNADTNAPMLKINTTLGFKHYTSNRLWQIEAAKVLQGW